MARTPFACADDRGGADDRRPAPRATVAPGTGEPEPAEPEPADPEPAEPEPTDPEPADPDLADLADPEPANPAPAGRLCVPVRPGARGAVARLFRTPVGARTAVAFTTPERLRATLGADQSWIPLSEPALRALAGPLGVHALTVDPVLTAPFTPGPASDAVPDSVPSAADAVPDSVPTAAGSVQDPAAGAPAGRPATPCARRFDATARRTVA
ncbi:SAV_915 family protein [Streptomyces sp. NPDC014861]|uniref:SAV_915 family protein n=1 Tax=Streptomyces sp. NPDC014861 TaxID=3364923 RepID=UPI0037019DEB